jgi:hypothetical protein
MSSEPPPNPITNVFNVRDWIPRTTTSSGGLTEAEADALYLSKTTADTADGIITFSDSISVDSFIRDNNQYTTTDLTSWNNYFFLSNIPNIGSSQQVLGYGVAPVVGTITFYPQANEPIALTGGFYNIQATFIFNLNSISGTNGRIAIAVTDNNATGDFDPATNGNFNNNIYKTRTGTLVNADFPLVYSVNFNANYSGYLYFKYQLQFGSASGTVVVNYMVTRIG